MTSFRQGEYGPRRPVSELFGRGRAGLAPGSNGGTTDFLRADGRWAEPPAGGAAAWGGITGTLSSQSDLQAALDAKAAAYAYGQLTANYTLTSTTAVQKLFNFSAAGALTLATGRYLFQCKLYLTAMSATSGNASFRLKGAGTATLANILQQARGRDNSNPLNAAANGGSASITEALPASMVQAATGTGLSVGIDGMFNVTVAGTIIPSIALVTAAAAIVQAGSHFQCVRIGATGSNTQGAWS